MPIEGQHLTDDEVAVFSQPGSKTEPRGRRPCACPRRSGRNQAREYEKAPQGDALGLATAARSPKRPTVKDARLGRRTTSTASSSAKLESQGAPKPVGDADRVTLIRRVTFDLTGLPPTPKETRRRSSRTRSFRCRVRETWSIALLASPAFGERWGRHWLDVARYGESTGPSRNIPYPHAWKYRDYVIDSRERATCRSISFMSPSKIAGDLLPSASNAGNRRARQLTATGFLALWV